MENKPTWRDGGWKSRKLWFSVFAVFMLYLGLRVAINDGTLHPLYESFVGGVVGVSVAFLAGNVGAKLVSTKTPAPNKARPEETPEE